MFAVKVRKLYLYLNVGTLGNILDMSFNIKGLVRPKDLMFLSDLNSQVSFV